MDFSGSVEDWYRQSSVNMELFIRFREVSCTWSLSLEYWNYTKKTGQHSRVLGKVHVTYLLTWGNLSLQYNWSMYFLFVVIPSMLWTFRTDY